MNKRGRACPSQPNPAHSGASRPPSPAEGAGSCPDSSAAPADTHGPAVAELALPAVRALALLLGRRQRGRGGGFRRDSRSVGLVHGAVGSGSGARFLLRGAGRSGLHRADAGSRAAPACGSPSSGPRAPTGCWAPRVRCTLAPQVFYVGRPRACPGGQRASSLAVGWADRTQRSLLRKCTHQGQIDVEKTKTNQMTERADF